MLIEIHARKYDTRLSWDNDYYDYLVNPAHIVWCDPNNYEVHTTKVKFKVLGGGWKEFQKQLTSSGTATEVQRG